MGIVYVPVTGTQMCVYCKEVPACDHECDSCAASRGEHCTECGHDSTAFPPDTRPPGSRTWSRQAPWPKQRPRNKATQAPHKNAETDSKEGAVGAGAMLGTAAAETPTIIAGLMPLHA